MEKTDNSLTLSAETLTALLTATTEDGATVGCGHTIAKAMAAFTNQIAGLICSFHDETSKRFL
jgi:hypothetical protein